MTFLFEDGAFHLLGDGEGLVDEGVWQTFHFGFGQDEAEVVLAVAAEGQRAVVLAEDWCVARQGAQRRQSRVYTGVGRHPRAG